MSVVSLCFEFKKKLYIDATSKETKKRRRKQKGRVLIQLFFQSSDGFFFVFTLPFSIVFLLCLTLSSIIVLLIYFLSFFYSFCVCVSVALFRIECFSFISMFTLPFTLRFRVIFFYFVLLMSASSNERHRIISFILRVIKDNSFFLASTRKLLLQEQL